MTAEITVEGQPIGPPAWRRVDPWAAAFLGLGVLLRAVYLLTPPLDSDRAVVGLMARHILQGEFPTFFWGQPYGGTLEAHLAAVLFAVLGPSRLALGLSPLLFSVGFLVLVYCLARDAFGRPAGRLALLLAAVPPPTLASHGVTTWGHYISLLVVGTLLLLLALRAAREPTRRRLVLIGFFAGLAWYVSPVSVQYLVPAGVLVLWHAWPRGWGARILREAWRLPAAFVLGSLPFWLYTVRTGGGATLSAIYGRGRLGDIGDSLSRYVSEKVPHILGVSGEWEGLDLVPDILLLALNALAIGYLLSRPRLRGSQLVLLQLVTTSMIVVAGYNRGGATRYLLPLYSVLPLAMAVLLQGVRGRSRPAFAIALAGVLAAHLFGNADAAELLDAGKLTLYQGRLERDARLFEFLRAEGLTRVYVFDYWDAYRLTFDAGETIVFAEPAPSYYPPYTRMVDAAPRYGYVIRRSEDARVFEENVRSQGGEFRRRDVTGYTIFDEFRPPAGPALDAFPPRDWRATASHQAAAARRAVDRDPGTVWSAGTPQQPGIYFELDLGAVRTVGQVVLAVGTPAVAPRGFRIDASSDGTRWVTAHTLPVTWPGIAWVGSRLRAEPSGAIGVRFAPVPARWLRMTLLRPGPADWAIQELFVAGPDRPETGPERGAMRVGAVPGIRRS